MSVKESISKSVATETYLPIFASFILLCFQIMRGNFDPSEDYNMEAMV